jgi:hypothetical protein
MDDYISKPVRFEDLSRAIEKWLIVATGTSEPGFLETVELMTQPAD